MNERLIQRRERFDSNALDSSVDGLPGENDEKQRQKNMYIIKSHTRAVHYERINRNDSDGRKVAMELIKQGWRA